MLSTIPKDLNFIVHTSDIGWKEWHRTKPVIIDPGLYSLEKSDVFWVTKKRHTNCLSAFHGFCVDDALPSVHRVFRAGLGQPPKNIPNILQLSLITRKTLPHSHMQCRRVQEHHLSHDLRFISWENPLKQHPHFLTLSHYKRKVRSNASFAIKFRKDEPVLDMIDLKPLGKDRANGLILDGCVSSEGKMVMSSNVTELSLGPAAERLKKLIDGLLSAQDFPKMQCA